MKRPGSSETTAPPKRAKKNATSSSIAKEALRKVNKLTKMVESKSFDNQYSGNANTTGSVNLLTPIVEGDSNETRSGDVVTPTKVELGLVLAKAAAVTSNVARMIVIQAKTSFTPTAANILVWDPATRVMGQYNFQNRRNFTVLYDQVYTLNAEAGDCVKLATDVVTCYPRRPIMYQGTSTTADSGNIWVLLVGDGASTSVAFTLESRVWYKDA